MFYDPRTEKHGLKHSPVLQLVVPRPIGWIIDDFAAWRRQSRALQLFQSGFGQSAVDDFFQRAAQAFADQCGGDRRIRVQSGDLGFARSR